MGETDITQWGHFQSLIQISIALNGTYFSLAQFLDPSAQREESLIKQSISEAKSLSARVPLNDILGKLLDEDDRIGEIHKQNEKFLICVRLFSVIFFFAGLFLLAVSSFMAQSKIDDIWRYVCIGMNIPVSGTVAYFVWLSQFRYKPISKRRRILQQRIRERLASMPAGE